MSNLPKPIQFLLEQLKKEENRERFNQKSYNPISPDIKDSFDDLLFLSLVIDDYINFDDLSELEQIGIIRTCLSRTKEGEAVIDVFEKPKYNYVLYYQYLFDHKDWQNKKEEIKYGQKHFFSEEGFTDDFFESLVETEIEKLKVQLKPEFIKTSHYGIKTKSTLDDIYQSFDFQLRNDESIDQAINALGQKMLELVPEYQELCKNN